MALTPGSRLGPYEVTALLGEGGMVQVYRATDSNLKRQVAIKVLPATVAGDVDRLARFQREAELLAALNHPNIAAIYGLEKTADFTALVMELVEGEDLSQRVARGAILLDEALPIARQIAEALETSHEQGIIHRDLKPAWQGRRRNRELRSPPDALACVKLRVVESRVGDLRVMSECYAGRMASVTHLPEAAEAQFWRGVKAAGRFFMGEADVHKALEQLVQRLDAHAIPYAIVGAMALNEFGYQRTTVDVDVLLTPEGLATFKSHALGLGYSEKFPGSRGLRDTVHGVDIDVILTGGFPGDGKPKPVVFPDPATAALRGSRVALLPLPTLIELKLASGMTAPHRLKDLADVQELIRIQQLPLALAPDLDAFVRPKYLELWHAVHDHPDE